MFQMRLEYYFTVDVQSTITEFSDCRARVWDSYVSLRSKDGKFGIQCDHFKSSFVSGTESLVRCNYSLDGEKSVLCSLCPLERTRRIWLPIWTERREEPRFVSNRGKFLGWRKG